MRVAGPPLACGHETRAYGAVEDPARNRVNGRVAKTEHLPRVVAPVDGAHPGQMNRQFIPRSPASRARGMRHGKGGTSTRRTATARRTRLGALGPVPDAIAPRTAKYIEAAVARLRPRATSSATRTPPGSPRSGTAS